MRSDSDRSLRGLAEMCRRRVMSIPFEYDADCSPITSFNSDHSPVIPSGEGERSMAAARKTEPPLPVLPAAPPAERADAARNRKRVLDAAAALFAERGVDGVSMD